MRRLLCLLCALLLAGCATRIDTRYTADGQDSRVLFLIIHFTMGDFPTSLNILTKGPVSSHYLLSDETPPRIYRLVDEERRAWHAGDSFWKGHGMLNASSVGIEIVNAGPRKLDDGREMFEPFREDQIELLIPLVKEIVARHQIRPERVLGHSDIRPQAKVDPGPMFPWKRFADLGLIVWPDAVRVAQARQRFEQQVPEVAWFQKTLAAFGYRVPDSGVLDEPTRNVIKVFQMRYRPTAYDGTPDAETAAILHTLTTPK